MLEEKTVTTTTSTITYTIGDDVITQQTSGGTSQHLLYDGHGSTRQLANSTGGIVDAFSYDAYGVKLGGNPTRSSPAITSLLYTGEYYDKDMMQYNLRARWYDSLNGRFNQLDPYAGNNEDPQSLHKYLYCHDNPVNGVDPSGNEFSLTGLNVSMAIGAVVMNIGLTVYQGVRHNLSGKVIAWQIIQNLAVFMAIIGATVCSGLIAALAAGTLLITFVLGVIDLVKSWPGMVTTDKIITAVMFLTFLAFAGAVRASVPPKPSILPGQVVSPLPDSYFSKFTVDMRNAPAGSSATALGYARNAPWFWKQVSNAHPEYFSVENLERIQAASPRSPIVDAQWIKYHTQHSSFMGETLIHHHIGQGPIATAVPQPIHQSWTGILHPYGGK